jgi:hypothetical protein
VPRVMGLRFMGLMALRRPWVRNCMGQLHQNVLNLRFD